MIRDTIHGKTGSQEKTRLVHYLVGEITFVSKYIHSTVDNSILKTKRNKNKNSSPPSPSLHYHHYVRPIIIVIIIIIIITISPPLPLATIPTTTVTFRGQGQLDRPQWGHLHHSHAFHSHQLYDRFYGQAGFPAQLHEILSVQD